jgi:NAD(P)-dependent dehydrogenase (short-subunit alcohol dehydrogenase family)
VTGSCGLIGSEVTRSFARLGFCITGIDSNHRAVFFGPEGDTSWVLGQLQAEIPDYRHVAIDIRNREAVLALMKDLKPDLIIHTAAQPSHDRAAAIPFLDFEVNALGTLHLLEAARHSCPESSFIHMSTNKVYPRLKLLLNRLANLFLRLLFGVHLNDFTNAFKAYRRTVIEGCRPLLSPHFNLTVELPLKTIVRGYSRTVMPITWRNRRGGESKRKIKEMGSRYLFIALYCWLEKYFSRGDYDNPERSASPADAGSESVREGTEWKKKI